MSKSRGNVIDPWTVLDTRGADALRWNIFSAGSPWTPQAGVRRGASTRRRASSCSRSGTRTRSSSPTRTSTAGTPARRRRPAAPTHVLDRWIAVAPARARSRDGHRGARRLRRAARRAGARRASSTTSPTGTCAGRGRGSGSRPTRAAHATLHECLRHDRAAARAVLPVRRRRDVPQPRRHRRVGAPRPTGPRTTRPRSTTRSRPRWTLARALVSLGRAARTDAKLGVRQPLRRAIAAAHRRRARSRDDGRSRDRGRAQREAARGRRLARGPARLHASCRTSARSARGSASWHRA